MVNDFDYLFKQLSFKEDPCENRPFILDGESTAVDLVEQRLVYELLDIRFMFFLWHFCLANFSTGWILIPYRESSFGNKPLTFSPVASTELHSGSVNLTDLPPTCFGAMVHHFFAVGFSTGGPRHERSNMTVPILCPLNNTTMSNAEDERIGDSQLVKSYSRASTPHHLRWCTGVFSERISGFRQGPGISLWFRLAPVLLSPDNHEGLYMGH